MNDPTQARKIVLLAFLVVEGVITFGSLWGSEKSFPKPSQYVGASVAYLSLAIATEFVPPLAAAFALLFAFYLLSRNINKVSGITNLSATAQPSNISQAQNAPNLTGKSTVKVQ